MAYVSKEDKAKLTPLVKTVLKKYNIKGTISVRHHSSLVVKLMKGPIDFGSNTSVNEYWIDKHYDGKAKEFLSELIVAMKGPDFFDNSDIQSDYFHRSHYIDIYVGTYDKPYMLIA